MKHLLLSISLIFSLSLSARTLSPDEALSRIYNKTSASQLPISPLSKSELPRLVKTGYTPKQQPAYYVFDRPAGHGYIILAADDIAQSMLGYSENGSFDTENIPDNMAAWLDGYAREIAWATEHQADGQYIMPQASQSNRDQWSSIAPLCTTKWNQGTPYNKFAPMLNYSDGSTRQCVTGCVATAMAQVMKYFNYPTTAGTGVNEYTWTNPVTQEEVPMSMDFSQVTFDWDNMLDVYSSGNYTTDQADAVALLMKACGYAVDMNYGLSSGSHTNWVAVALKENFGYDASTRYYNRNYYDIDTWEQMLYDNLRNVGPIEYSGYNDGGGHAFVVDGYSSNGFFHLNWGWGGMSDGYFLITALDPSQQGIGGSLAGYNNGQAAILGAQPSRGAASQQVPFELGIDKLSSVSISSDNEYISLQGFFSNIGDYSVPVTVALQFCDETSDDLISNMVYDTFSGWTTGLGLSSITTSIPSPLSAGTYKVYPVYSLDGGNTYHRARAMIGSKNFVLLSKTHTGLTASTVGGNNVSVEFDLESTVYAGRPFAISGTISNPCDTETLQQVGFAVLAEDFSEIVAQGSTMAVDLRAGDSAALPSTMSFSSGSLTAGVTYCACYYDTNTGAILSNIITFTAEEDPGAATLAMPGTLTITDSDNVDPDNISISYRFYCSTGFYSDILYVLIYNEDLQGGYIDFKATDIVFAQEGNYTEGVANLGASSALESGNRYAAVLFYIGSDGYIKQLSYPVYFTVKDMVDIDDITSDTVDDSVTATIDGDRLTISAQSEILAVDIYDLAGIQIAHTIDSVVDMSARAAGIYIVNVMTTSGKATLKVTK